MKIRFPSAVSWLPFFAPEGDGGGGAAGGAVDNSAFLATLPEPLRAAETFKGVKDTTDLATRYHTELTRPFAERLPEKIRGDAAFKDIKSLDGLADSYINQGKLLGVPKEKLLRLPDDDKPESWAPVFERLGRPPAADKYAVKPPKEGYAFNDNDKAFQAHMLPVMHKYGVTQKQLDGILAEGYYPFQDKLNGTMTSQVETRRTEATNALKTEWGSAFDQRLADGEAALNFYEAQLKLPGLAKEVKEAGLHISPNMIKFLSHIGGALREDGKLQGGNGGGGGGGDILSPVEAQQQIAALRQDQAFMKTYNSEAKSGPDGDAHKQAVMRMNKLYDQAYPAPQA